MYSSEIGEQIGDILESYVQVAVLLVGIVGNPLAFLVFSRPFFAKTPIGFYLRMLTLADSATILINILNFVLYGLHLDFTVSSSAACKVFNYFTFIPNAVSAWIEALVSLDRVVNVVAPSSLYFLKTSRFSRLVVLAIIVYNLGLYSPLLVFYRLDSSLSSIPSDFSSENESNATDNSTAYSTSVDSTCLVSDGTFYSILSWYDMFNSILVPCFIMLGCAVLTVRKLYESRRIALQNRTHSLDSEARKPSKAPERRRVHRDRQYAITSVSLCFVFLALNVGLTINNLLASMISVDSLVFDVVFVVYSLNYSIKFYVYLIVNHSFLVEFKNLLFLLVRRARITLESSLTHKPRASSVTQNRLNTIY